jgi:hypothetical protein
MRIGRRALLGTVTLSLVLLSSCRGLPTGPSLANIVVGPLSLAPTAGDRALCCCRVTGTARNENSVPVHATFTFTAFDAERVRPISKVLYFIGDFRPGAERPIDAHGFVFPCDIIKDLRTELDIRGLAFPPL